MLSTPRKPYESTTSDFSSPYHPYIASTSGIKMSPEHIYRTTLAPVRYTSILHRIFRYLPNNTSKFQTHSTPYLNMEPLGSINSTPSSPKKLLLKQTCFDMSFYYTNKESLHGLFQLYFDDTIAEFQDHFKNLTDEISKTFESKPRQYPAFLFTGIKIPEQKDGFFLE